MSFESLVREALGVPVEGWDFSFFEGRATESRPSWGYASLLAERLGGARSALDLETGGGEVFAWALATASSRPPSCVVTEPWPPNAVLARERLARLGATVVRADGALPFRAEAFELVSSRHPVDVEWSEIARILGPGGTFFSQMIGAGSNRELYEYLMGPQPEDDSRSPATAVDEATAAGLEPVDLRQEALDVQFFDIGAVVHFLLKVPWTVPDFSIDRYRSRLMDLHEEIEREGRFSCHSQRFLIEVRK